MGLREYQRKRDFKKTPEPAGEVPDKPSERQRAFVVQKHAASRLHYDFRLELEGVLKSWAIPKGPSLDPGDKRLAMHVEDHPLDYGGFEGIIPKGQYGGGTVLLWDRGTWEPVGDPHKSYRAGSLKFALKGEKLTGRWALVRIGAGRRRSDDDRSWLLIKERDEAATPGRAAIVESEPRSVATGRTLEEIAGAGDRVWNSNRDGGDGARPAASEISGARRAAMPGFIPPQLATLVDAPPSGAQWLHELKHDGYRILARLDRGRVKLMSRNGRDWTDHFPAVAAGVARLPAEQAFLDGEVTVLLPNGASSFQALQNFMSGPGKGELAYMIFDLVYLDGSDLTGAPLEERKAALAKLLTAGRDRATVLRYSDHVVGAGSDFFEHACGMGLEGIVSKRRDAPYRGRRGAAWLKIKCLKRQEIVIGGYTDPEGSRLGIGALLGGVYEDGRLSYAGKIGTGFNRETLRDLKKRLTALDEDVSPFSPRPTGVGRPHWVKPELVAEVSFSEWTSDGKLRHSTFLGLREDKPARAVIRELPADVERETAAAREAPPPKPSAKRAAARTRPESPARQSAARKRATELARAPARPRKPAGGAASGEAILAGVRLTHPDRVLYPPLGTTKLDLARFYESIADWILPHLADRPTTLVRCPEGVHKPCFYQKHVGYWAPESVRRVKIQEKRKVGVYLVVDSLAALIGLVQIGILEIHTWNSVVQRLEQPDRVVFDLDPGPGVAWSGVIDCARLIRDQLRALGLASFVKTTGGRGLHVVMPLSPGPSWEDAAEFARGLAESMARDDPRRYTARMAKSDRERRIYIDYLRNVRGATSVAAYSTRAKPEATISVPLAWDELSPRISSAHFTLANLPRRLAELAGDPWAAYWTTRQSLPARRKD
ncbi:MAG TPA: DNA ligase D [Methylomirabilota bacterium]|nr:DNA ligase D [Methylomirabilota bacterium]